MRRPVAVAEAMAFAMATVLTPVTCACRDTFASEIDPQIAQGHFQALNKRAAPTQKHLKAKSKMKVMLKYWNNVMT